jgi:hypothetical protein
MSYHFSMGAINKHTNNYEYPKIADKKYKYKCPCCEKDVIFKNGKIKQPHFSHYKSDNPCYYYDKPSESQIHKDAKLLMKSLLDNKKQISIDRSCNYCEEINYDFIDYNETTKAVIEYKFYHNNSNRSADVALIENENIKYIFEICYKNKTKEENRPEPWIEINAEYLINNINSGEIIDEKGDISIKCIRNYKCVKCVEHEENENRKRMVYYAKVQREKIERERLEQERERLEQERERLEQERMRLEQERMRLEQERMRQLCKCGIIIINLCMCNNPKYKLNKLSNNFFCINCDKWKCRCSSC